MFMRGNDGESLAGVSRCSCGEPFILDPVREELVCLKPHFLGNGEEAPEELASLMAAERVAVQEAFLTCELLGNGEKPRIPTDPEEVEVIREMAEEFRLKLDLHLVSDAAEQERCAVSLRIMEARLQAADARAVARSACDHFILVRDVERFLETEGSVERSD
jgi:hypothetical protein